MVAEIAVFVGLGVCMALLGLVTWLFRSVARMLDMPFGTMEWLLHGLGFLVTLPFVLAILVLWKGLEPVTWWVAGGILLAALVSFLGGAITLVRDLVAAERRTLAIR